MENTLSGHTHIIKLERGEELIASLASFCTQKGIRNAHFSGIGAASFVSCGYYALEEKKYYFTEYAKLVEVASLTGNITLKEGNPFVHAHGVFTDETNQAFGGHIKALNVGVTLEIMLTVLETEVVRTLDEEIGLYLFNCKD